MKHLINITFFVLAILFFSGCDKKETEINNSFKIEYGSECGWCAGQEYITVTSTKIEYIRAIPCGENNGTTNKWKVLSPSRWEEITASFDYSLFKTLQYTDCNVCVDGCDEIIRITEEDSSHELRYSISEEVEGMENLQEILSELMEEMREMD